VDQVATSAMKMLLLSIGLVIYSTGINYFIGGNELMRDPASSSGYIKGCGCVGDIDFKNFTSDTLYIYLMESSDYSDLPLLEQNVLPSISLTRLYADFYIEPHDHQRMKRSCARVLLFEATNHRSPGKVTFRELGGVRRSCDLVEVSFEGDSIR
jgi:hypothetical protein